jgi:CheY-like chemotaxis protein
VALCDIVKARPDLAHIPIIFMTASVQRFQQEEGYRHGVAGYLSKPFSPAALRAKIAAFVDLSG